MKILFKNIIKKKNTVLISSELFVKYKLINIKGSDIININNKAFIKIFFLFFWYKNHIKYTCKNSIVDNMLKSFVKKKIIFINNIMKKLLFPLASPIIINSEILLSVIGNAKLMFWSSNSLIIAKILKRKIKKYFK